MSRHMTDTIEDSLDARMEGSDGDAGIQAPADHEARNGGRDSRNVDTLSVNRGRTGWRKAAVSERSCSACDGGDRQRRIVCGMDRAMNAERLCHQSGRVRSEGPIHVTGALACLADGDSVALARG